MNVVVEVLPLADALEAAPKERMSQATALVRLAAAVDLWHDAEGTGWVTVDVHGHREHHKLTSKRFRQWLSREYYQTNHRSASSQAMQEAIGILEGNAVYDGAEYLTFVRIAALDDALYIDLTDADWRAVRVDCDGWLVVTDPPVRFRRSKGALPLPVPTRTGSIGLLRKYVHVADEADWRLIVSWLVAAFRDRGPYPLLALYGEQGSGKSTTARLLSNLVDPRIAALRAQPDGIRDVAIAATNGWLVSYDNLSHFPTWFSDVLCRLSTGGGFATRALYENDEEALFDMQRPAIFTAIEEIASRSDLLSRAIVVTLPTIAPAARRPEAELLADFKRDRPAILGALLDAVSLALQDVANVNLDHLPRMADFAEWAVAAAPALGWTADGFIAAYAGNRDAAHDAALDAVLWLPALRVLIESKPWDGTATALLADLNQQAGDAAAKQREWPKNGRSLAGGLKRLAPALRATGIDVTFSMSHHPRTIAVEQGRDFASPSSLASLPSGGDGTQNATRDANGEVGTQTGTQNSASTARFPLEGDAGDARDAKSPVSRNGHYHAAPHGIAAGRVRKAI